MGTRRRAARPRAHERADVERDVKRRVVAVKRVTRRANATRREEANAKTHSRRAR